ncbi:hypothetical protein [Acetomicrobium sp. UBA5826]|uniref:hypothetical protein n=1 Tax=Acetomicrobium sp. UBA5826 TaxID=1946039 RepID=UPI00257C1667|nr:hypothetical protein [Acetomicrobium sp. UBA5826]
MSQDRLEPKVTDILRRICWPSESIKYTALVIAGYPQSVEDDIVNERLKNSLMGTQVRGRINETDEMDSRGKVCGSDEMSLGLKTVSESRKYLLTIPFATKPPLDLLFVNLR